LNSLTHALVRTMKAVFDPPGPVLEIGSRQVQQTDFGDLRAVFPGAEYVGCDVASGPGVDRIEHIEAMSFPDGWAGTVLCLNVLEHVWDFRKGVEEILRVTAPGGAALVVTVFEFHVHDYPDDYWRFTPQALERLFEGFESVLVGWQGTERHPRAVFVLGLKKTCEDLDALATKWRLAALDRWDERPSAWARLRAAVGSLLFGRRAFRRIRHYRRLTIRVGDD